MTLNPLKDIYPGFLLKKNLIIEELQCQLIELVHEKTGAEIMYIGTEDPENLFSLSFRTLPYNSNGVAHILEHIVLCGSQKFPVKDPFFSMTRRSLNTFMNALTGSDFTCYPAASQVEKDFYNLLEVYLDAVFFPALKKESFWQEGVRLEFSSPTDPSTPLQFQGIVYNEMKGVAFSPDSRIWHTTIEHLLPDTPYAHVSGGDPKVIPSLTYEELQAFHQTYYHPSRCLFFFYGNLPLEKHLDFLGEKLLKDIKPSPPLPPMKDQPRFSSPKRVTAFYPAPGEDLSKQGIISFSYLMMPATSQDDLLTLALLDSILMDTDASPLKFALIESKLAVQTEAYLDPDSHEIPYLIICKGCQEEKADQIEEILITTLKRLAEETIPSHLIEAALHQLEFSRSEIGSSHSPFGLTLFMRAALAKQHHCPPENALIIHSLFEKLREKTKDPFYLSRFIEKYFLNNPHRVRLVFTPSLTLIAKETTEERGRLALLQKNLTEEQKQEIVETYQELDAYQKKIEDQDIDCLPKVTLADVPSQTKDFSLNVYQLPSLTTYHHNCFTNHIVYASVFCDINALKEEELSYLPLFNTLLTELGCGQKTWQEQVSYLHAYTGGINASCQLHFQYQDHNRLIPTFSLRGKCLARYTSHLFQAFQDIWSHTRFDETQRIKELLLQIHNHLELRLQKNALRYATQLSLSGFGLGPHLQNLWSGLSFYQFLTDLVSRLDTNFPLLIEKLFSLKEKLITSQNLSLVLSCNQNDYDHIAKHHYFGLTELARTPPTLWINPSSKKKVPSQVRSLATQVSFTSMAYQVCPGSHKEAPALYLAALLFEHLVLHPEIREQGGAYGAGASYHSYTATFNFYSYRDPFIHRTLNTFEKAIQQISDEDFTEEDLLEAKLSMIQHLDLPTPPGARALTAFQWLKEGKSWQIRQNFRESLLATTKKEIAEAVKKYLLNPLQEPVIVSFASEEFIDKEKESKYKLFPLTVLPLNSPL